jgi:hypothetical protein
MTTTKPMAILDYSKQAKAAGKILTIGTAAGTVTIAGYVAAWKRVVSASSNPDVTFKQSLTYAFGCFTGRQIRREFLDGVNDRINQHLPWYNRGRKWEYDWQIETARAAHQLNTPRLRIYQLPSHLSARFAHRLCRYDD